MNLKQPQAPSSWPPAAHLTTAPLHVPEPTVAITPAPISNSLNMDFGSATVTLPMAVSSPAPQPAEALVDLEFLSDGLDFTSESLRHLPNRWYDPVRLLQHRRRLLPTVACSNLT